jgi:hypothetical protein
MLIFAFLNRHCVTIDAGRALCTHWNRNLIHISPDNPIMVQCTASEIIVTPNLQIVEHVPDNAYVLNYFEDWSVRAEIDSFGSVLIF